MTVERLIQRQIERYKASLEPTPERVEEFHLVTGEKFRDRPPEEIRERTEAWLRERVELRNSNLRTIRRW